MSCSTRWMVDCEASPPICFLPGSLTSTAIVWSAVTFPISVSTLPSSFWIAITWMATILSMSPFSFSINVHFPSRASFSNSCPMPNASSPNLRLPRWPRANFVAAAAASNLLSDDIVGKIAAKLVNSSCKSEGFAMFFCSTPATRSRKASPYSTAKYLKKRCRITNLPKAAASISRNSQPDCAMACPGCVHFVQSVASDMKVPTLTISGIPSPEYNIDPSMKW
mmetsp:Transcript_47507/g.152584  ORF Transcript_47507/g.152584 Transcript_47507/m.152584 type:complete len:223 (-) Transcript_47507:2005-2673(-)